MFQVTLLAAMIRIFSIFCKLNQIHLSDRQWVEKETESLFLPDHVCPVCHAHGSLSPFASYTRCLVEREKGKPAIHEIVIKRLRCRSCGHTHAQVSSALVPYSSYSLRFILQTLRDYFLGRACVQLICDRAGIAVSTLYRWKDLFIRHKALWMKTLNDLSAARPAEFAENMDGHLLQHFYQAFRLSFLQGPHSRHPESPPERAKAPSAAT